MSAHRPFATAFATLLFSVAAPVAHAQDVQIDANGIRTGSTTIDASGIHTPGATITSGGVVTHSTATVTTTGTAGGHVSVVDNNRHGSFDCGGGAAEIAGNDNSLTLKDCSSVSVTGNDNHITASLTGDASVNVPGNNNSVRYTRLKGVRSASVSNLGNHNSISGH